MRSLQPPQEELLSLLARAPVASASARSRRPSRAAAAASPTAKAPGDGTAGSGPLGRRRLERRRHSASSAQAPARARAARAAAARRRPRSATAASSRARSSARRRHTEVETKGDGGPKAGPGHSQEPGRRREDIQTIVMARRDEARACYDKGLKDHPGIEGDLTVKFVIDPQGVVSDAVGRHRQVDDPRARRRRRASSTSSRRSSSPRARAASRRARTTRTTSTRRRSARATPARSRSFRQGSSEHDAADPAERGPLLEPHADVGLEGRSVASRDRRGIARTPDRAAAARELARERERVGLDVEALERRSAAKDDRRRTGP